MKVEITQPQLEAIKRIADEVDGYIGGGSTEWNNQAEKNIELVDRFLKRNGEQRQFGGKERAF